MACTPRFYQGPNSVCGISNIFAATPHVTSVRRTATSFKIVMRRGLVTIQVPSAEIHPFFGAGVAVVRLVSIASEAWTCISLLTIFADAM